MISSGSPTTASIIGCGARRPKSIDGYPEAAALLRAIYDMVDRLKSWEEARGLDGHALFQIARDRLMAAIADPEARTAP